MISEGQAASVDLREGRELAAARAFVDSGRVVPGLTVGPDGRARSWWWPLPAARDVPAIRALLVEPPELGTPAPPATFDSHVGAGAGRPAGPVDWPDLTDSDSGAAASATRVGGPDRTGPGSGPGAAVPADPFDRPDLAAPDSGAAVPAGSVDPAGSGAALAHARLAAALGEAVDAEVRRRLVEAGTRLAPRGGGRRSVAEEWLRSLVSADPWLPATIDHRRALELERAVSAWVRSGTAATGPTRLCLRLREPQEAAGPEAESIDDEARPVADQGDPEMGGVDEQGDPETGGADGQSGTADDPTAGGADEQGDPQAGGVDGQHDPEAGDADGHSGADSGGQWFIELLLQDVEDPSLIVGAADVWAGTALLGPGAAESLLAGIGRMARIAPSLAPVLEEAAPTAIRLSTNDVVAFARDHAADLVDAGIAVMMPAWWGYRRRLSLRAKASSRRTGGATGGVGGGLGMDELVSFRWEAAMGDHLLTPAELRRLSDAARAKRELVRVRGEWVEVRPGELEAVLARAGERSKATAAELLRAGLGLDHLDAPDDVEVIGVEATGWLGPVLDDALHAAVTPVPTPPDFVGELRPYQQRGVGWLSFLGRLGLGACLADDMGLGKTAQLIASMLDDPGDGPALVVCPVSVLGNWARELERFAPHLTVMAHHGPRRFSGHDEPLGVRALRHDVVLTTYSLVARDADQLAAVAWSRLVLDEAQQVKNPSASQTRAVGRFSAPRRVALTGTPVENRLSDLWSIMHILNPGLLGSARSFRDRFARPIERGTAVSAGVGGSPTAGPERTAPGSGASPGAASGADATDAADATGTVVGAGAGSRAMADVGAEVDGGGAGDEELERQRDAQEAAELLRRMTGPFLLRRLKSDRSIISDLPDKIELTDRCPLTTEQVTLYQAVVDDLLEQAAAADGIARRGLVLAGLMRLKQVCNHPAHFLGDGSPLPGRSGKLTRVEELLDEILDAGDRVLCFTQFAQWGHLLVPHLQQRFGTEVLWLHGGVRQGLRDEMVERFGREDGPRVFLLSLKAGGTGLNLTAASHVVHLDRWWNPAVEDQATDRAHRIGQRRSVLVHKLVSAGTVEERIDALITAKRALAERVVGTGEEWLTELSTDDLRQVVALSTADAADVADVAGGAGVAGVAAATEAGR